MCTHPFAPRSPDVPPRLRLFEIARRYAMLRPRGGSPGRDAGCGDVVNLLWVAVAVPVVSCLLLALAGPRLDARAIGLIACGAVFISFALILLVFFDLVSLTAADRVRVS